MYSANKVVLLHLRNTKYYKKDLGTLKSTYLGSLLV